MAFLTMDTNEGPIEVTVFNNTYEEYGEFLVQDTPLMLKIHVNYRNNEAGYVADELMPIEKAESKFSRAMHIQLENGTRNEDTVKQLAVLLGDHKGNCNVFLHCGWENGREVIVHATTSCLVEGTPRLAKKVEELVGDDRVWLSAGHNLPTHVEVPIKEKVVPVWQKSS
jgi:DNA polymerase-3 subunit alpha